MIDCLICKDSSVEDTHTTDWYLITDMLIVAKIDSHNGLVFDSCKPPPQPTENKVTTKKIIAAHISDTCCTSLFYLSVQNDLRLSS